ncbi:hypothetical protein HOO68_03580 [Candidatus Gracilibacteria bacterium]|nr:hypothetical protein [Candidatus Gracilibacteria bacterium]
MNGNIKYSPEKGEKRNPEKQEDSIFLYLEQLRVLLAKNPEVLKQLDVIAEKLKRVSEGVQFIIGGMLKSELARIQASSVSSTAAIMAANDERFQSVA